MTKIYDIFLDFLNRDSREIYGVFDNISPTQHITILWESINIAVFLCKDYCIMPPGFLLEDKFVQKVFSNCNEFLYERLIRMPLRETSIQNFFEKKEREYRLFKKRYSGLYNANNINLLKAYSLAIVPRKSNVGSQIISQWEEGPDVYGIWKALDTNYNKKEINIIRNTPARLYNRGVAVTWAAIDRELKNYNINSGNLRHAVQHHYFTVYTKEFNLKILKNLPYARTSFFLESDELDYDYESLKNALSSLRIWNLIRFMSAESLINLRTKYGYMEFRESFARIARQCESNREVGKIFALCARRLKDKSVELKILQKDNILMRNSIYKGIKFSDDEVFELANLLNEVSQVIDECHEETVLKKDKGRVKEMDIKPKKKIQVAIFVALQVEREIIVEQLEMKTCYPKLFFSKTYDTTEIVLFGPDDMGRVPATVETMKFLQNEKPDLIIVAGIAGGFQKEGASLGDLIVATSIADLATRKIRVEDDTNLIFPEFRPREFHTDRRVENYLKYKFDLDNWERKVLRDADWPKGLRPKVHFRSLASLDEVVSSTEWVERLCKSWPKLVGVEMEAGGVCAAAAAYGIKVAVIRGVSDLADPAKSDDEWRRRAIKTVSNLLNNLDYCDIVNTEE